jgi:hypothetical protein
MKVTETSRIAAKWQKRGRCKRTGRVNTLNFSVLAQQEIT